MFIQRGVSLLRGKVSTQLQTEIAALTRYFDIKFFCMLYIRVT